MTAFIPPFLLVLDLSALMAGKTREWQMLARIGDCFVPKAVLETIEFLCNRAAETQVEQTAREFSRFYLNSGWQAAVSTAEHPLLQPTEGHELSSKARLALTVAQSTYALARRRPDAMIILVTNDQGLLQRIRSLEIPNLCGIPYAALGQWLRTERKPPVIVHQLQVMRLASPRVDTGLAPAPTQTSTKVNANSGLTKIPAAARPARPVPAARPIAPVTSRPAPGHRPARRTWGLASLGNNLIALGMVAIALLAIWRVIDPAGFGQFWQRLPFTEQARP